MFKLQYINAFQLEQALYSSINCINCIQEALLQQEGLQQSTYFITFSFSFRDK